MLRTTLAALALTATSIASAASAPFAEGQHYTVLSPAQPTSSSPEVIEIVEFFWYGCPHCYAFEPHLEAWEAELGADVNFIRIPGTFNALYKLHAKAYYTAESLGVLDEIHPALFEAIHDPAPGQERPLDEDSLAEFFAQHGVSEADFRATFNSFAVTTAVARAESLQRRYRVAHVPTIIVNGKYVTDGNMASNWPRLIQIMNHLVGMERAER